MDIPPFEASAEDYSGELTSRVHNGVNWSLSLYIAAGLAQIGVEGLVRVVTCNVRWLFKFLKVSH